MLEHLESLLRREAENNRNIKHMLLPAETYDKFNLMAKQEWWDNEQERHGFVSHDTMRDIANGKFTHFMSNNAPESVRVYKLNEAITTPILLTQDEFELAIWNMLARGALRLEDLQNSKDDQFI